MSEKEIQHFTIRMPKALYQRVVNAAADRRMSINAFVCEVMEGAASFSIEDKIKELEKRIEALENKK